MSWIQTTLREIWGLFVDDGVFAAAIVLWLAVVWLLARFYPVLAPWAGWVIFGGLAVILVESLLRYARKQARKMRE
jgi:ABC-type multidrug transport system permease subunit